MTLAEGRVERQKPLTSLLTGATAAMIGLTGCALYLVDHGTWLVEHRFWSMIAASSSATLLVMSLLHSDLQRLYGLLAAQEKQAQREARIDQLSGLGNRKALGEQIEAKRCSFENQPTALFLIDLNHFKRVNDTRGHEGGDELLKLTATRLEQAIPESFTARLGGDEFAILVDVPSADLLPQACESILQVFAKPFPLSQGECFLRGSVGAALLEPGLSMSDVLRRADAAMYSAKSDPRGFKVFDEEMLDGVERRGRLVMDLQSAAPSFSDCSTVYQPIFSAEGSLVGVEALLRWRHPELGEIPPAEAISVAEEVYLINQLGLRVVQDASDAARLLKNVTVAFNVSVVQLLDSRFTEALLELVPKRGLQCSRFQIEVRECDFMVRGYDISSALRVLRDAGFKIAVDDFGSSASSLIQLQRYGATVVKLDPKVLRNAREVDDIAIMQAKVHLAKALGMSVTCEGVAVEADRSAALKAGCDMLQGYLLGRPQELKKVVKNSGMLRAA